MAEEDFDGDQKITVRDHTTQFDIHFKNGAMERTSAKIYCPLVLLQEFKCTHDAPWAVLTLTQCFDDEGK